MKKILYIHHSGILGGAPRSLSFLINGLDKKKFDPIVLMVDDGPARKIFEKAGAKVIVEKKLGVFHGTTVSGMSWKIFMRNILEVLPSYIYGKKIIKEIDPDIVHLNTTCLFIYAKALKKLDSNIPVVCHVREPLLDSHHGSILREMNYKYVDAFIAIEEYDLSKINTKGKLSAVVYNSVDFKVYNPEVTSNILRDELNLTEKDIIFLYLARFSKTNGTLEFVKTIRENRFNDNIHFVMVGYVDDGSDYNEKVFAERNDNIHVIKFRDDIPELIASSDVVVSPFTEPHFSRTVIEGAAMGKPSLVSNVKGLDELVVDGETGYIYDLSSPNDLSNKIINLAENYQLRINMGNNAYKRALNLFDTQVNSLKIFKIYETLLNNK